MNENIAKTLATQQFWNHFANLQTGAICVFDCSPQQFSDFYAKLRKTSNQCKCAKNLSDTTKNWQAGKSKLMRDICFWRPLTSFLHIRKTCQKTLDLNKLGDTLATQPILCKLNATYIKKCMKGVSVTAVSRRRAAENLGDTNSRSASRTIFGLGPGYLGESG